ncbi:hypothetical protein [Marinobacter mangrovi]|uniref:hypothetical protein n=1 Tax=Marinobacter mangrovi TaxID=2803918 RepID=UPI0019342719|nr:hypothetical protein [Marinobacter mangrovi]
MLTRTLLATAVAGAVTLPAWAGVESMTSDEMVDTYIEDSAIIVVPRARQKSEEEKQRVIRSLTISPGEPAILESDEQAEAYIMRKTRDEDEETALANAEQEFIRRTLLFPLDQVEKTQPAPYIIPSVPTLVYGRQVQIPDEPFTQSFLNDQLSLGFDGQNVNFSIGNVPGVDQIQVPQSINEAGIVLTPRAGGGFDLSIPVPDAQ